VEEAGRTTLDELRWYKELGVNGVLLDDPHLALQVNSEHG
jgi:glycerophosphoryl diester phosphodiesterase